MNVGGGGQFPARQKQGWGQGFQGRARRRVPRLLVAPQRLFDLRSATCNRVLLLSRTRYCRCSPAVACTCLDPLLCNEQTPVFTSHLASS